MIQQRAEQFIQSEPGQRTATDYTPAMLNEWKRRVSKGEFFEDWQRISKRKDFFLAESSKSEKYKFKGPYLDEKAKPLNTLIEGSGKAIEKDEPSYQQRAHVYDAAFWSLLKADSINPAEKVQVKEINKRLKDLLLFYATTPGLDFSNRNRWSKEIHDLSPGYTISLWVHQLEDVFQVCKQNFSSTEKDTFINWIYEAASFSLDLLTHDFNKIFANRSKGDYRPKKPDCCGKSRTMQFTGKPTFAANRYYNNRRLGHLPLIAKAGAMQANQKKLEITMPDGRDFRAEAEKIYKEAIAFGLYPTGECIEMTRNEENKPSQGMGYSFMFLDAISWVPYYRLLEGDDSLYFYQTSAGVLGSEDPTNQTPYVLESVEKQPKSLLKAIKYQFDCMNLTHEVYGTRKEENYNSAQKELFRYDGSGMIHKPEWLSGHFLLSLQANLGLKSAFIRQSCEHPYEAQGKKTLISKKQSDTSAYQGVGYFRPSEGFFGLEGCLILKYYGMEAFM